MILNIIEKELLHTFRTVRFVVFVLVCWLLMPVSVWVLSHNYLQEMEDYQGRVDLEERRETGKDFSINVNRPVPQLSALFRGASAQAVNSVELKYYVGWNRPTAAATQSITQSIFPTVDLTFIIGVFLSALVLMVSFDALCGEKAEGTLKLMLSNSVSRASIVIGKWLGLSIALLAPFLVGLLISLLIFFGITGVQLSADNWVALAIAIAGAIVYLSLFVLIGIVISAIAQNPAVSIFVCLGVWGLLVIALPQAANAISDALAPAPSPQLVEKNIRQLYNAAATEMRENNRKIIDRAHREGLSYQGVVQERFANELKVAGRNRKEANDAEREFWLRVAQQEDLGRSISLISPYGALTHALVALANTGPETQREFLIDSYRYGERYFGDLWATRFSPDNEMSVTEIVDSQPKFSFAETSIDKRAGGIILPLSVLVLSAVILVFVGIVAFNRYDVR